MHIFCYEHASHISKLVVHADFIGPSRIPPLNVGKKMGSSAWGMPHGVDAYHASNDASLFSSSLPVLPHEKCTFLYMCVCVRDTAST